MDKIGKKSLIFIMFIISIMFLSQLKISGNEEGNNVKYANILYELGLFKGTLKGYELTKESTRAEAAVMLVRFLGAEEKAILQDNKHPFIDVPSWASPHIGYLYKNKLTNGIDKNIFGSDNKITGNQYTTMILRSLYYSDKDNDYRWDDSIDYGKTVGLYNTDDVKSLVGLENIGLLRDYMVKMSYNSLFTNLKNTEKSLISSLIELKAIDKGKLNKASQIDNRLKEFLNIEISGDEELEDEELEDEEFKAVWITYLELQRIFKENKTEESFKEAFKEIFKNIKEIGLNTVIVQVKPFSDTIYPSDLYPWSHIISGEEGVNPGYDPLKIIVEEARLNNIKIEAWINPFRIRAGGSKIDLSNDNIGKKWLDDKSNRAFKIDQGIYFNPGSKDARDLIKDGIIEIINNYDIDGIHFDDYFYPSTSLDYDAKEYKAYKDQGGKLSQGDWRRENINILLKDIYRTIKGLNPDIQFGISPQAILEVNYSQQFIDVKKWVEGTDYIDYICPQIYFGYEHDRYPYKNLLDQWNSLIKNEDIKLYIGLAPYKVGREDIWAGKGKNEWVLSKEILKRMILDGRLKDHYKGFVLFRYDYIVQTNAGTFVEQMIEEIKSLKLL